MRIPSGVTDQYVYFVAVDATDFTTRETGLSSFTVYRSRNGGAAAAMTTPTVNETDATNMPGVYELLLDEDMTIDAGDDAQEMAFHITHAGMAPVTRTIELYRVKISAGDTLATTSGAVDTVAAVSGAVGSVTGAVGSVTGSVGSLVGHTVQTGDTYALANGSAGFVAIDTVVDTINTNVGTAGAGLTNINLPNQTMDIVGNITGNLSGTVGSVTGAVGSVTGHTAQTGDTFALANGATGFAAIDTVVDTINTNVGTAGAGLTDVGGMSTGMKAEVNAEMVDVMATDTISLPGQTAPPLAPTRDQALGMLYKAYRNRSSQTATTYQLYADNETTVDQKRTVSDDDTTAIAQEVVTGP